MSKLQTCQLLITNQDGKQVTAAVILFDGKRIAGKSMDGYGTLLRNVLAEPVWTGEKEVSKEDDPKVWFNMLPKKYNGTYLRASIE